MNFKKWVKSIQTAGYNGARTVDKNPALRSVQLETPKLNVFAVLNSMIAGGSTNTMGGP